MLDDFDRSADLVERERESCVERARTVVADMPGPAWCVECGLQNNRRKLGYATCLDCFEDLNGQGC